jgi:putative membrane protein
MFIDFLTLMLTNLVVALVLFALFIGRLIDRDAKKVVPGFLLTGFIALMTGFRMIFTWPLPGPYNFAYGEMTVLYGGFFFVAGLAIIFDWDLISIGIYAFFAGIAAVIVGARILDLRLTNEPLLSGVGFLLTGLSAILTLPALFFKEARVLRIILAVLLLVCAVIWAFTGYAAYWQHFDAFAKWAPATMK